MKIKDTVNVKNAIKALRNIDTAPTYKDYHIEANEWKKFDKDRIYINLVKNDGKETISLGYIDLNDEFCSYVHGALGIGEQPSTLGRIVEDIGRIRRIYK